MSHDHGHDPKLLPLQNCVVKTHLGVSPAMFFSLIFSSNKRQIATLPTATWNLFTTPADSFSQTNSEHLHFLSSSSPFIDSIQNSEIRKWKSEIRFSPESHQRVLSHNLCYLGSPIIEANLIFSIFCCSTLSQKKPKTETLNWIEGRLSVDIGNVEIIKTIPETCFLFRLTSVHDSLGLKKNKIFSFFGSTVLSMKPNIETLNWIRGLSVDIGNLEI